jgi:hypothetical protein
MKLLDFLGTLILGCVAVAAVIALWAVVWMFFVFIFGLCFLVWACGTRIQITKTIGKEKVVIGHLRWFTFTEV